MAKRPTIGVNPLDALIPRSAPAPTPVEQPARVAPVTAPSASKERLTVHLSPALIDRVKNAVYWTPGLTLAGLAEDALRAAVEALEARRGDAFPPRREELKGGRPLK